MTRPGTQELARCIACKRWWSVPEGTALTNGVTDDPGGHRPRCACGGLLRVVDMAEHLKTVSVRHVYDASKDKSEPKK